jgi:hypothetical protein
VKRVLAIILIILITAIFFIALKPSPELPAQDNNKDFYVGVTFTSNTTAEAKLLVDKVKNYTNVLVVDSGPVSKNETSLNEICDYAVNQGLHIIVYFGNIDLPWQIPWIDSAKQRWSEYFLGVYHFDEPAGSLLDTQSDYLDSSTPQNCDEMANLFVNSWQTMPGLDTIKTMPNPPTTFTSDYALYWFDYLAGYDVILSQFGWNNSRAQQIALVRGAAKVQNKSWGAIVTWTYDKAPYLENGDQLYNDMVLAYENGAKYVFVFNYPTLAGNSYGDLTEGHFNALQRFWNKIQPNPHPTAFSAQNILVLPRNYGWGMRAPNDTIWGLWGPDEKSPQIWNITQTLLARYGSNIDIVYDDPRFSLEGKYTKIYFWNSTI